MSIHGLLVLIGQPLNFVSDLRASLGLVGEILKETPKIPPLAAQILFEI